MTLVTSSGASVLRRVRTSTLKHRGEEFRSIHSKNEFGFGFRGGSSREGRAGHSRGAGDSGSAADPVGKDAKMKTNSSRRQPSPGGEGKRKESEGVGVGTKGEQKAFEVAAGSERDETAAEGEGLPKEQKSASRDRMGRRRGGDAMPSSFSPPFFFRKLHQEGGTNII